MKIDKIEFIIGIFFVCMLVCMMIYVFFGVFYSFNNTEKTNDVKIDFSTLYPFESDNIKNTSKEKNIINKYSSTINSIKEKIENYTSKNLIGYEKFVEFSYLYDDCISYKLVSNFNTTDRVELEDGYFSCLSNKKDISYAANRLKEFKLYLDSKNIKLLYVQAPFKISQNQQISSIYNDYSNYNMDNLLESIKDEVDYIDLRESIIKNNLNHLRLFYKTDHHWLPETGLWATNVISEYLNKNYNMNLKMENVKYENYNNIIYEKMYLGADGRYVSLKKSEPEDFTLIKPKFETKLSIKILTKNIDTTNDYENTLIDLNNIKYGNYYKISQYSSYMYGDVDLIEIHNELIKNNKKILVIKDSFAEVVTPFIALENEYLSIIDLRHFNGSLKNYINNYNPDLVLILYNGGMIVEEEDKNSELWYFE